MTTNTKPCNAANYQAADRASIGYLVIHYTGNEGDTAAANAAYFARERVGVSAHYFVDESAVWQSVADKDVAWHCGTKGLYYHPACRNANSIGIEICMLDKRGKVRQGSVDNAVQLTRQLMARYGITASRVMRHYDVTRKNCPAPMVEDAALWARFKAAISAPEHIEEEEMIKSITIMIDGQEYQADAIEKDGRNYVQLRSFEQAGYDVTYDASKGVPGILAPDTRNLFAVEVSAADYNEVKQRAGLSEDTMQYLVAYKYGDDLLRKLAGMK